MSEQPSGAAASCGLKCNGIKLSCSARQREAQPGVSSWIWPLPASVTPTLGCTEEQDVHHSIWVFNSNRHCTNARLLVNPWLNHLTLLQSHSSAWICCYTPSCASPTPRELPCCLPQGLQPPATQKSPTNKALASAWKQEDGNCCSQTTLLIPWDSVFEGYAGTLWRYGTSKSCERLWQHLATAHRQLSGSHNS